MKTKEELDALKEEVKNLKEKLSALTEDELAQVTGGAVPGGERVTVLYAPEGYGDDSFRTSFFE